MNLIYFIKFGAIFIFLSILMIIFGILAFRIATNVIQAFFGYKVPFVRTNDNKIDILLEHINLKEGDTFVDLGCGDGKILEAVSGKYPNNTVIGYEKSYYPYKLALKKKVKNKLNYEVYQKDFFEISYKNINIIYTFIMPYFTEKIREKMKKECSKGTLLYSNSFPIDGVKPFQIININYKKSKNIFIYKI